MTRLYVAGPMSGIAEFNFPAFAKAARELRGVGYEVVSPHEMDEYGEGKPTGDEWASAEVSTERWQWYLRRDLKVVLDVDGVATLDGWERSKGATLEVGTARSVGIPVHDLTWWLNATRTLGRRLPRLVGLSGFAGSGKDSVAAVLVGNWGFARVAFADAVRDVLYAVDPVINTRDDFIPIRLSEVVDGYGWDIAKRDPEVRRLLQRVGTEAGRDILGQDIWVDVGMRKADKALGRYTADPRTRPPPPAKGVVFTDVRFDNEAHRIREAGGVIVYVRRPAVQPVNDHVSERLAAEMEAWDGTPGTEPFGHVIGNGGTLADLEKQVDALMRVLTSGEVAQ
jgi:hypothetical protein